MTRAALRRHPGVIASITIAAAIFCASIDASAQSQPRTPGQAAAKPQDPATGAVPPSTARTSRPPVQQSASSTGGQVVARVGDTELGEEAVRAYIASLGQREKAALARDPSLSSQMVRSLLLNQLVLEEALAKHWDQRPSVADQIQKAREATIVESYLRSVSEPPADFPTEAAIQNVYDANKTAFLVPRQFQIAQIYVALPANADKATVDKATKKLADIELELKKPNADFAAIARRESDATDAAERGGEIGWLPETQLRPEIKALVVGLAKGAVSEPAKLDDGWHIVKLLDTKAAYTRPLAEVRDELARRIREEQATANRRAFLAELSRRKPLAINEIELARILNEPGRAPSR